MKKLQQLLIIIFCFTQLALNGMEQDIQPMEITEQQLEHLGNPNNVAIKLKARFDLETKLQNSINDLSNIRNRLNQTYENSYTKEQITQVVNGNWHPIFGIAITHNTELLKEILPLLQILDITDEILNIINDEGFTPLIVASESCVLDVIKYDPTIIKLLIDNGANPNIKITSKTKLDLWPIQILSASYARKKLKKPEPSHPLYQAIRYLALKTDKEFINSWVADSCVSPSIRRLLSPVSQNLNKENS